MKTIISGLLLLLSTTLVFAQADKPNPANSEVHFPRVISAEVPLYPPVAWSAHLDGTVEIEVTVEGGIVARTEVKSTVIRLRDGKIIRDDQKVSPYLVNAVAENLKTWRFALEERTTFRVTYTYRIEGGETVAPVTPTVFLELPTRITVTAKPFKPTTT